MGYSHYPGQEFTFLTITSFLECIDNFNKSILEDIFSDIPVHYLGINKTGNSLVVSFNKNLQGCLIAADIVPYEY